MDSATIGPKELKEKPKEGSKEEQPKKEKVLISTFFMSERVLTENTDPARELYNQSRYGKLLPDGRVQLSLTEAMYLLERGKILVLPSRGKKIISPEQFTKLASKQQKNFFVKYSVFKDIRDRGYIIKTALKFGADFRVYDRGVKPGEDHARWIIYPVHEGNSLTWQEFSAKNRVAHSTKKRLLIGVVDDEGDVSYWECRWLRP
ncbi:MAG TPA: tRNA-intron lyase [Candidatus Nanoarchaeia archaeon]|nr:tRNA-intron lyase [Candidatus Nanoarchaeia archaeon]